MQKQVLPVILSALGFALATSQAATIAKLDVTTTLGTSFFFDNAAIGGTDASVNQPSVATFDRNFGLLNVGAGGSTINITGIGWALNGSTGTANDATSVTVGITYLGSDGLLNGTGTAADVLIGSVTDSLTFSGAGEYAWAFTSPISATINGLNNLFRIVITPTNVTSNGSLTFKNNTTTFIGADTKLSVAGTSVAVIPEPNVAALLGCLGVFALICRRRV